MTLRQHAIYGGIAAVALSFYWGPWRSVLFWVAAWLIDADHYWDYLWRSRFADWSPKRMFRYYDLMTGRGHDKRFYAFSLLHNAEIFLVVWLLAHYINYVFFITVLLGMLFHLALDMIELGRNHIFFVRSFSIIEYWIRRTRMLRRGIDVDSFYKELFEESKKTG
jgi:hypothetical protein